MKKHTIILLSAVLLTGTRFAKAADPVPPVRNPFGTGELPEFLKPFDVNHDGKLDEEERQAYRDAARDGTAPRPGQRANPFDTNHDGVLSDEEKAAAQEAIRAKIEAERNKRFDELDKNDDGFLSAEEFLNVPGIRPELAARILAHLDKDGDKQISKAEFLLALRPPRPSGGGDGGGGGGIRPGGDGGDPPPPPPAR